MKAIVLLLVVAVCQGLHNGLKSNKISPLLSFLKKALESDVDALTNQHPKHPKLVSDVNHRQMVSSDPNCYPGQKPMVVETLDDYKYMFTFPGSNYLIDVLKAWQGGDRELSEIRANFELPMFDDLESKMPQFMDLINDLDTMAVAYTRIIMHKILDRRAMCASAVIDSYAVKMMTAQLYELFKREDTSMYKFLLTKLPHLTQISVFQMPQEYVEEMAADAVKQIHRQVFDDAIHYILGSGYMDVANMSHNIYTSVEEFCKATQNDNSMKPSLNDLVHNAAVTADVRCRTREEIIWNHVKSVWFFKDRFQGIEKAIVCEQVKEFVSEHMTRFSATATIPLPSDPLQLVDATTLDAICTEIKSYIDEVVNGMVHYETVLTTKDSSKILQLLENILDSTEMEVLQYAWNEME